jgi:hypothetical protein
MLDIKVVSNQYGVLRKSIPDNQLNELRELYLSGISVKDLSKKYMIQPIVLKRYLKKLLPNTTIYEVYSIKTKRGKNIKKDNL